MLTKIRRLIEALNVNGLTYCHWKSNLSLAEALSGQTDIDLLIHRKDASAFRTILGQLCFRPALTKDGEAFPSMEHYLALDEESGLLVHVHAYYRVITGESLAKNYRFPLEEMLLQNTRQEDFVRVPTKSAELVVFTLRMMLKHTSMVELLLLARDWEKVKKEIVWLLEATPMDDVLNLVNCWLRSIDTALFSDCVSALKSPAPLLRRITLAHRLRSRLSNYARRPTFWAWLSGIQKFTLMLFHRLSRSTKGMIPQSGGAVIAFVGPEATGKSTLLTEMKHWLGEHFVVDQIHAGKPKSTLISFIPNLLVPALRYILPTSRSSQVETQHNPRVQSEKSGKVYPFIFAIRSVLLAYDRRALLSRAFARAANGNIILCDRYPTLCSGAPDSPQLLQFPISREQYPIRHLFARIEERLYQEIPAPDLVISLSVPVEVAVLRNKTRGKEEPEEYVRLRHALSTNLDFERTTIYKINTDQPLNNTVIDVKKAIWNAL